MTNKKKRRAKALSKKTGMSHAAAHNVLNQAQEAGLRKYLQSPEIESILREIRYRQGFNTFVLDMEGEIRGTCRDGRRGSFFWKTEEELRNFHIGEVQWWEEPSPQPHWAHQFEEGGPIYAAPHCLRCGASFLTLASDNVASTFCEKGERDDPTLGRVFSSDDLEKLCPYCQRTDFDVLAALEAKGIRWTRVRPGLVTFYREPSSYGYARVKKDFASLEALEGSIRWFEDLSKFDETVKMLEDRIKASPLVEMVGTRDVVGIKGPKGLELNPIWRVADGVSPRGRAVFTSGQILGPDDLRFSLKGTDGEPLDPDTITFSIQCEAAILGREPQWYSVNGGRGLGSNTVPQRIAKGEYYARGTISDMGIPGGNPEKTRILWDYSIDGEAKTWTQEFTLLPCPKPPPVPEDVLAAISEAKSLGDVEKLRSLLHGVNPEGILLQWAVACQNVGLVAELKDAPTITEVEHLPYLYAVLDVIPDRDPGYWQPRHVPSPLEVAARKGSLEMVQLLLDREDSDLEQAALEASRWRRSNTLRFLLGKGVDVNFGSGALLRNASWFNHNFMEDNQVEDWMARTAECLDVLFSHGADPNLPNPDRPEWNALVAASEWGIGVAVEKLLAHGADPNLGEGGLSRACTKGSKRCHDVCRLLIEHGANRPPFDVILRVAKHTDRWRRSTLALLVSSFEFTEEELSSLPSV